MARRCFASMPEGGSSAAQRNRNVAMYMVAIITGMLGFSYFSVPLYRMFCAATGYGGTVSQGQTVEDKLRKRIESPDIKTEEAAAKRQVTVTFVSEVQPGLPWSFKPCQSRIRVRPGQSTLVFYTATNHSDEDIIGVSTYNVTPASVGYYFNKIQCFCFEEQRLRPGESVDMPIFFYIDPEFATDKRLRNVDHVTLSYVFFKSNELPTNVDGTPLVPGESMPAHLLPSQQAIRASYSKSGRDAAGMA